jgi:ADP-ribose pyrophosphatase
VSKKEVEPGCISSRRVYSGKVVSLDVDTVLFPNGSTGELEIIRHAGASAVVPFLGDIHDDDPQILLIRQYRYAASGYVYEVPAGLLNEGETPEVCARRELREETGYTAAEFLPLSTFFTTPGFTDEQIRIFLATDLKQGQHKLDPDEFLDPVVMPISEALERIRSGEISDAKTICGLLYVAGYTLQT